MSPLNLSTNFTLKEATNSDKAKELKILNIAPAAVVYTMRQVAEYMEILREAIQSPILINSWYRCPAVNKAVGSKDTSQHMVGEAVDFKSPAYGTPLDICRAIIAQQNQLPFDQLILEHSWVHISFAILNGKPKGQVLSLLSVGGYASGLTTAAGVPYD